MQYHDETDMTRLVGDRLPVLQTLDEEQVQKALIPLSYREREIFKLRTGISDGFCYSVREVALIFKISSTRASQIHKRARQKFLAEISKSAPNSQLDQIFVQSVLSHAKELTPFLIKHLQKSDADLRLLPWQIFEHLIAEFFASWGYQDVQLVGRRGTTAADVFAMRRIEPNGTEVRVFVETKRWKERVGVEVVDRVYGAMMGEKTTFGWHLGMIVTVAGFTDMKKYSSNQLRLMGISLKDGQDVRQWLQGYKFNHSGLWLPPESQA